MDANTPDSPTAPLTNQPPLRRRRSLVTLREGAVVVALAVAWVGASHYEESVRAKEDEVHALRHSFGDDEPTDGEFFGRPAVRIVKDDKLLFRLDPNQPFELQLWRGSGWHGYDTIMIHS